MLGVGADRQESLPRFVQPLTRVRPGSPGVGRVVSGLARLRRLGLEVPPGFVITSRAAEAWHSEGALPDALAGQVALEILDLQAASDAPQLLVVRASADAAPSLPPLPSFLDVGLDRKAAEALGDTRDASVTWGRYERLLQRWAVAVERVPASAIDAALASSGGEARRRATALEALLRARQARLPPPDLVSWVCAAAVSIWRLWEARSRGAGAPAPAVVVQRMIPDAPGASGVGLMVSRDPGTGSPRITGGFAGGGHELARPTGGTLPGSGLEVLAEVAPQADGQLREALALIEAELQDACEVAFAVEDGHPWLLEMRPARRSAAAALRIAVDLVDEGLITVEEALQRVPLAALQELQAPVRARDEAPEVLAVGQPVGSGQAAGAVVLDADTAQELAAAGRAVVLICESLSLVTPFAAVAAQAVVCSDPRRDATGPLEAGSHGHPVVVGATDLTIDRARGRVAVAGKRPLVEGDVVSVDGARGLLARGAARLVPALPDPRVSRFLDWCAERQALPVLTAPELARRLPALPLVEPRWPDVDLAHLRQAVDRAGQDGPDGLALALPSLPPSADLWLPAGPWRAVVAEPERSWAATLLAARPLVGQPSVAASR
jgi:pyruvate,orthophosphate dikinase